MDLTDHSVASQSAFQLGSGVEEMSKFCESKPRVVRSKAQRPHSSPVRSITESQHRQRIVQKTTSTARVRSQQEMGLSECSLKNLPFIGAGEKVLWQRPPASAGMAYFADHPPIIPVHIVVVKQNAEPNQIIPFSIAVTTSTDLCVPNNPDVATSTDLKRASSSGEYFVRRMLRDLMTALPLRLMSSPASHTRSPSPVRRSPTADSVLTDSLRVRSPRSRVRSPPMLLHRMSPPHSVRSRGIGSSPPGHHRLNYTTFDQISNTTHTVSEKGEGTQQEDWMGGVRALRDSHVRLVLRQLRHIERLNRALDRFTKVSGKR